MSRKPLWRKLGYRRGLVAHIDEAPGDYRQLVPRIPQDVRLDGTLDDAPKAVEPEFINVQCEMCGSMMKARKPAGLFLYSRSMPMMAPATIAMTKRNMISPTPILARSNPNRSAQSMPIKGPAG